MGACGAKTSTIIGALWVLTLVGILCGVLPWAIYELRNQGAETHVQSFYIAGAFVALSIPMTIWDICQHLRHFNNPVLQKQIVRILWMIPIYAITSWLALRFKDINIYLDTVRECYEAYVLYNFFAFLLSYLRQTAGFDRGIYERTPLPHLFPFNFCFKPWAMNDTFIPLCSSGIIAYIIIRPMTTILALIFQSMDMYKEGEIKSDSAWVYIASVNSFTQGWAMYCLILFYFAFKDDLKDTKPLGKVSAIKLIIFFSFWQSVLIALLVHYDIIKQKEGWNDYTTENVAAGIQDFAICIEMFLFSIGHHYVFSYREFLLEGERAVKLGFKDSVKAMLDVSDVKNHIKGHVKSNVLSKFKQGATSNYKLLDEEITASLITKEDKYGNIVISKFEGAKFEGSEGSPEEISNCPESNVSRDKPAGPMAASLGIPLRPPLPDGFDHAGASNV